MAGLGRGTVLGEREAAAAGSERRARERRGLGLGFSREEPHPVVLGLSQRVEVKQNPVSRLRNKEDISGGEGRVMVA